jgi:phenylpropionate dioxygenase-like ring-hydroxylating dioxygenase large terminal subunit
MSVEVDVAERLLGHLRAGTTDTAESDLRLPAWHYFDPDHAARERALFLQRPLVAAAGSSLATPGAFVTLDLIGVPVLLIRQADGSVVGVRNVCRHRGGRVEQEASGSKRVFTCRYHGWTYDRDGSLRNVPFSECFDSVEPACHGLVPVATAEGHGFIWVQLGSTGPLDLGAYLGAEFDEQLSQYAPVDWTIYVDESFTQPINWKLIADGLLDILHPKFLHPESVGRLIQTNTHTWDRYGHHGRLSMARSKLDRMRDDVPAGTDLRRYVITNFFVYPNTMLVVQPDHVEIWTVYPDAESPEMSTTSIRFLVPRQPETDEERAPLDLSWRILRDAVTQEDWPMAQSIQRGAKSTGTVASPMGAGDFVYGRNEVPVQHLHRRLAEDLEALEQ